MSIKQSFEINVQLNYVLTYLYCQSLVPNPVPLDPIPIPNPKKKKIQSPMGLGMTLKSHRPPPHHHPTDNF